MDEWIELPEISGIKGAKYDPSKKPMEQEALALAWAMAVRQLPYSKELSVCEYAINGQQKRFPKKVWVYEGYCYIEETEFTHSRYHAQFYARQSAAVKIEKL